MRLFLSFSISCLMVACISRGITYAFQGYKAVLGTPYAYIQFELKLDH